MDAREELIGNTKDHALTTAVQSVLWNASNYPRRVQPYILGESVAPLSGKVAAAILAAGYRKMPDREAVIRALAEADEQSDIEGSWKTMEYMYSPSADAILALMEGNK